MSTTSFNRKNSEINPMKSAISHGAGVEWVVGEEYATKSVKRRAGTGSTRKLIILQLEIIVLLALVDMLRNNGGSLLIIILFFLLIEKTSAVYFNQPKFSPNASWNPNATTFAPQTVIGLHPHAIFIDKNDAIYAAHFEKGDILMWYNNSINLTRTISGNLSSPYSIFVTPKGDIYANNAKEGSNGTVSKWTMNTKNWTSVISVEKPCYGLFVDVNDTLYCSLRDLHKVVKQLLSDKTSTWTTAAGTGTGGSASNMLHAPLGIFVSVNFDLYVADRDNNRIQRFQSGQPNGATVVGTESPNFTITLHGPAGIVLDADNHIFIVDHGNHRIVGSGPNGFRCIAGCNGEGSASNQLSYPLTLSFDRTGNMFVTDISNHRIQKFLLLTNKSEGITAITTNPSTSVESTRDSTSINPILTSTIIVTTEVGRTNRFSSISFVREKCDNSTRIGVNCNLSKSICSMFQPCLNDGICHDNDSGGYFCSCPPAFNGSRCQFDHRLCKPNLCWNNGTCDHTTNATFPCLCSIGWEGKYCQTMVNFCKNATCLNKSVCRRLFRNYTCECLGNSYSGRHCEITAVKIKILQIVSKSFAYIAIIALVSVAAFFIIMDILKYCFGIDLTHKELQEIRRRNQPKKRQHPVVQRFIYVNASPSPQK